MRVLIGRLLWWFLDAVPGRLSLSSDGAAQVMAEPALLGDAPPECIVPTGDAGLARRAVLTTGDVLAARTTAIAPELSLMRHRGMHMLVDTSSVPVGALRIGGPEIDLPAFPVTECQAGYLLALAKGPR